MKITVKQVVETIKVVEVDDSTYKDITDFRNNLVGYFDNFTFEHLDYETITEDIQLFLDGEDIEDICFELEED